MRLTLNPSKTIKSKAWRKIVLFIMLAFFSVKSFAVLWFAWPIAAALGYGGLSYFSSTDLPSGSSLGIDSVGGDIFYKFYNGLDTWLEHIYQAFGVEMVSLLYIAMTLAISIMALSYYFPGQLGGKFEKAWKFIIISIVVVAFIEDYGLFKYWFVDTLLDIQIGILNVLLGTPSEVANLNDKAKILSVAIFAPVDDFFIEIFASLERFKEGVSFNEVDQLIVFLLLMGVFGFLYAIFFVLVMIGFFGFYFLLGFAPVILFISLFHKQLFFAWLKTMLNFYLIPIMTVAVMSMTIVFLEDALGSLEFMENTKNAIFSTYFITPLVISIFSIGLHWKAPELSAALTGGVVSSAGSVVGTAAAVAGGAWAISKSPMGGAKNMTNLVSGMKGGSMGNQSSGLYRGGQGAADLYNKMRTGGTK